MGIKRLNIYLIKGYLGTFIATFCVCLFIVLMQFLWKYVGDMVGKGLSISILLEFFGYAALSLVPMALPLSILLSSLMAFGNLGEKLELLAMKASGISLFKIMKPFVGFVSIISIGAFLYSDFVLPVIQDRLYILTRSMVQKSPEVEIPEGSFYQGVPGVSVFVGHKDHDTKLLRDIMLYDFSGSSTNSSNSVAADNISITCADSGRIGMSDDQQNLVLTLHNGVTFENIRQQNRQQNNRSIPYRRENFKYKQIFVAFDNSMKMVDASITSNKYVGKNFKKLTHVVDSLAVVSKELAAKDVNQMVNESYFERTGSKPRVNLAALGDCRNFNFQQLFDKQCRDVQISVVDDAISHCYSTFNVLEYMYAEKDYMVDRNARRHDIERHRKVTMSLACLLFFFIGAPLGAIIRKGGLGTPIVISVVIFILYYVVDNSGYKLAREGVWYVWAGIWLSSAVLLPLGAFLTYKAATDSMVNISKEQFSLLLKRLKSLRFSDVKSAVLGLKNKILFSKK
ncbi:MAG: LptF/LptG family permease [Paludibacteraceae bacterium]|nr:LptF/LptG family permease [Paludibacteraceae bacterium]